MTIIVKSSRQASTIFSLDGNHPPRLKNLFYVSFTRGTNLATDYSANSGDLGFLVKSTERPQIQPMTEELNQYNKKRIINTGIKYAPLRISFYDTTDGLAKQMFSDYAKNYFGAFGHALSPDDYNNDVLTAFTDNAGTGWGFAPTAMSTSNTDANSQYYFRKISIYEVWGGYFSQTDIINPRITAFDPEAFSYEDSAVAAINMTVAYEAVVYANNGGIIPMSASAEPGSAFDPDSSPTFDGNNVTDNDYGSTLASAPGYTDYQFATGDASSSPYLLTTNYSQDQSSTSDAYVIADSVTSGALATYGDYDFGAGFSAFQQGTYTAAADLIGGTLTNSSVASALNTSSNVYSYAAGDGTDGITTAIPAQTYSSDQADVALASVSAIGTYPSGPDTSFYAQKIAAGALSSAKTQLPREKVFTTNPRLVSTSTNSWDSSTPASNGIALASDTYEAINQQRPASAQIGFNNRTLRAQSG